MTPKEKAIELFEKYYRLFNNFPNYQYVIENLNTIQDEKLYTSKQCALIAVDEMIAELAYIRTHNEELDELIDFEIDQRQDFLIEVEKEIKAL